MHVLIKDGAIERYPYAAAQLRLDNPNCSFPETPSDELLAYFGVHRVFFSTQPQTSDTQVLIEEKPVFDDTANRWTQVWRVRDMTADEIISREEGQAHQIRSDRNYRLSRCDWTQLADSVADKALWAAYRQGLRDIPSQSGFPWNVIWPVEPGA
jgi:hypothetical protein